MHRAAVSLDVFIVSCLRRRPGSLCLAVTVTGQHSNQSFPLWRCDLLLDLICVSVQRF